MGGVKKFLIERDQSYKSKYRYEAERFSENIYNEFPGKIVDKETFDAYVNEYAGKPQNKKQQDFYNYTFELMVSKHPRIKPYSIYEKAGGKKFNQDRLRTAKKVYTEEAGYIKAGAGKADLKGYDTRQLGSIKGKIVYVTRTTVKIKGVTIIRYRDKKGRFAKIRK